MAAGYWRDALKSRSYWKYALFSPGAAAKFMAAIGFLYLLVDAADFFDVYTKDQHSQYGILFIAFAALLFALFTNRPVSRISYRVPNKDIKIEVKIGDIFSEPGGVIISSNTTFDTDMSSGLISTGSLQGQFATKFFNGQTNDIDDQIKQRLSGEDFIINDERPRNKKEYPLGTVARISSHNRNFYFFAMSFLDSNGTAYSDQKMLDQALEGLWKNVATKAELDDIAIPLIGTGRGRVALSRKKVIEKISQSFVDASQDKVFSNKLTIVVRPEDAANFSLNLFQVRDYLSHNF